MATNEGEYLTDDHLSIWLKEITVGNRCGRCEFWEELQPPTHGRLATVVEYHGFCHRYPPSLSLDDPDESLWPLTSWNQWCGEFVASADNLFDKPR